MGIPRKSGQANAGTRRPCRPSGPGIGPWVTARATRSAARHAARGRFQLLHAAFDLVQPLVGALRGLVCGFRALGRALHPRIDLVEARIDADMDVVILRLALAVEGEGAELFCHWLTDEYNKDPKRKFHKVVFRLPSEAEWILAAKGGDPEASYPWKGTALQNKKGRYNCNFKRPGENEMGQPGELVDGADVTAPVLSYSPNAFGLYNMSGNVAEMLTIKGRTKGGSWLDEAEFIDIDANQSEVDSDAPSPTVGFRYFMEVLEK